MGLAEGGIPIGSVWSLTTESWAVATIDVSNAAARSFMQRWIASKMQESDSQGLQALGFCIPLSLPVICAAEWHCSLRFQDCDRRKQDLPGPENYVRSRGVQLEVVQDPECIRLMAAFH